MRVLQRQEHTGDIDIEVWLICLEILALPSSKPEWIMKVTNSLQLNLMQLTVMEDTKRDSAFVTRKSEAHYTVICCILCPHSGETFNLMTICPC